MVNGKTIPIYFYQLGWNNQLRGVQHHGEKTELGIAFNGQD